MTRLYKAGAFVADTWVSLDDRTTLPIDGRAIVPLARWRAELAELISAGLPIGVAVGPGEAVDPRTDNIDRLGVIAIAFAKFTDGRGYSQARMLREQAGYKGELRATGEILLDQVPLLERCGFDALAVSHAPTIAALERGHLPAIAQVYQPTGARPTAAAWLSRRSTTLVTERT